MIRQADIPQGGMCLDLCSGTGDLAHALYRLIPEGKIIALDFSESMLQIAQQRFSSPTPRLMLVQGDAMQLPFASHLFDIVTVGFGLRNVENLFGCLKDILRVLKPGGVLITLDVGKVRLPIISVFHHFFFFYIVPLIGKWLYPGQDMFDYLPHSSLSYPDQETLKQMMLQIGFTQVKIYNFMFGAATIHIAHHS